MQPTLYPSNTFTGLPKHQTILNKRQRKEENGIDCLVNTIQCGDSSFLLKQIPDNSIDLVVTSPPYYLQRDYNERGIGVGHEKTVERYIDSLLEVFSELIRVVKTTGNIVYNLGDKYQDGSLLLVPYRFAIEVTETYPVRLINDITWVKKNPTPRQFTRRLVSSTESFFHFAQGNKYYYDRDSFSKKETTKQHRPTNRLGETYRGLIDNSELSSVQKNKAHQALDEVVNEVKEGVIAGFRMKIRGIHAEAFGGQGGGRKSQMDNNGFTIIRLHGKGMKKDVIESTVAFVPGIKHTAMFPCSIIKELVRLLCPVNGIVLDPYIGSGTTAIAAVEESRQYIGIDIDPIYCELAKNRISECRT